MDRRKPRTLIIDKEFRSLIRPLRRQEYLQLEKSILDEGCLEPIITWNGTIVDGHNRYEICRKHGIPFDIKEIRFASRAEVLSWICANQLGRSNITEEARKYLIGLRYETEKLISERKRSEITAAEDTDDYFPEGADIPSHHVTAQRIAQENNVSFGTVQKYAIYTRALDEIEKKVPGFVEKILSGRYKISHANIVEISKLSPEEIKKLSRKLERNGQPYLQYNKTRTIIPRHPRPAGPLTKGPSVKDMPVFDPDAPIIELTLTIPSWISSINRTKDHANLSEVSTAAKEKLIDRLVEFERISSALIALLKEE